MPASRRTSSSLLATVLSIFAKASPEQIRDLQDELGDTPVSADLWNGHNNSVPNERENPTGVAVPMSGKGAEQMMREYADPQRGDRLTEQYDQMAKQLSGLEGVVKALGGLILEIGKATGTLDDDAEQPKDEDGEEDKTKKGALPMLTLREFFSNLQPRSPSRATGKAGLAPAPDFAVLAKAAPSIADRIDNANLTMPESIAARSLLNLASAVQQGIVSQSVFQHRLGASPIAVRDLFNAT